MTKLIGVKEIIMCILILVTLVVITEVASLLGFGEFFGIVVSLCLLVSLVGLVVMLYVKEGGEGE